MRRALKHYNEDLKNKVRDATEELKKNFALQEKLLQSSLDAFIGTDREGKIILFNQSAQSLSGYTVEELQGIPDPLVRLVPEWSAFVSQAIQGQEIGRINNQCLIKRSSLFLQNPGGHSGLAVREPAVRKRPHCRRDLLPSGSAGNGPASERIVAG